MRLSFVISSALILSLSAVQAAELNAPLASGKPAGLHQAQLEDGNGMFLVAGAAVVGIAVALATAGDPAGAPAANGTGSSSVSSTTTTSP